MMWARLKPGELQLAQPFADGALGLLGRMLAEPKR